MRSSIQDRIRPVVQVVLVMGAIGGLALFLRGRLPKPWFEIVVWGTLLVLLAVSRRLRGTRGSAGGR